MQDDHIRRSGRGRGHAVLSHGFGTDQGAWDQLRDWFDDRYDVLSYDLAGCGPTGAARFDFERHGTMFGYADDLIDLLEAKGISDCLFVGHSMSAMIGAIAASARPDLISHLVMIGASPRYLDDADYKGGFQQAGLDALFAAMAANYQAWVAGFAPMVASVKAEETVADFSRTLFDMQPDVALAISRMIFQSDLRGIPPRVTCPVTLIQTAVDVAVPVEVGAWLQAAMPQATRDIIDAEGHLPHMSAPAEVRRILDARLG